MTLSCGLAAVDVPNLDRVERVPDTSHCVHLNAAEHVTRLLIDFFALAKPAKNRCLATREPLAPMVDLRPNLVLLILLECVICH